MKLPGTTQIIITLKWQTTMKERLLNVAKATGKKHKFVLVRNPFLSFIFYFVLFSLIQYFPSKHTTLF